MTRAKPLRILLFGLLLALLFPVRLIADVSPGDIIDKTNWQKAEGLLPGPVLDWVKSGDYVLHIGELSYKPAEYYPPAALASLKTNIGKYDLDKNDGIIDVKTGKLPDFIEGIPFPKIDPKDPKAGQKILYNKNYNVYSQGNLRYPFQVVWVGRGGYQREVECEYLQIPLDGYPPAKKKRNPDGIERYTIISVWKPYDIAGTAVMLWRYRGAHQELNFSYLPAIRRVRRMSAANRSDAFVGSDGTVDDAMGYDGKISAFTWKVIEKKGWQGAPWCPTNLVWAKRPAWVVLAQPKDRYYNYGDQYIWADAETFFPIYKVIHDRAGGYWKVMMISTAGGESADKEMRFMMVSSQQSVDDRTQHSTYVEDVSPRNRWAFFADVEIDDFTLAGFQKYCK